MSELTINQAEYLGNLAAQRCEAIFTSALEMTRVDPATQYVGVGAYDGVPYEQVALRYKDRYVYLCRPTLDGTASTFPYRTLESILVYAEDGTPDAITEVQVIDRAGTFHTQVARSNDGVPFFKAMSPEDRAVSLRVLNYGRMVAQRPSKIAA